MQNAGLIASVVAGAVAGEGLCELEGVVGGAVCEYVNGHIVVGNNLREEVCVWCGGSVDDPWFKRIGGDT